MRKLTMIQHMSLDGVIQGPGGEDEDRDGSFDLGGWISPYKEPEVRDVIVKTHGERLDLILGRRVYDIWATYWPNERNPMADIINFATKYVATHIQKPCLGGLVIP